MSRKNESHDSRRPPFLLVAIVLSGLLVTLTFSAAFNGSRIAGKQTAVPTRPSPTPPPRTPIISYWDYTADHYDLKVAKCGDLACSAGNTITTVDAPGLVGSSTSIALGADRLPVISYYDGGNKNLKVAKCGNPDCTAANTITTVDSQDDVGAFTSIAIGSDDLPVIAYYMTWTGDLKVAKCGNPACSAGNTITTVDAVGNVGAFAEIAIGTDGLPVISYSDITNGDLKVAKCGTLACSAGNTITTVDAVGDVGRDTSITLPADGLPVISYWDGSSNGDLKVAKCGNPACTSGNTLTTVDAGTTVGRDSSITIGTDGLPVISYFDSPNSDLKVAHCGDAACTVGNKITTVDGGGPSGPVVGFDTSITIAGDGLPVISYRDFVNKDLRVAKCGNRACTTGNTITIVDSQDSVGKDTSIA